MNNRFSLEQTMRILTCDPKLELLGLNLRAFIDNLQADEINPVLIKYGLTDVEPMKWYSAAQWLNALNDLQNDTNMTSNLVAIGMEIGRTSPVPPGSTPTLADVLTMWNDVLYQPLFRNGDPGSVSCEKVSDTHYVSIHRHIWPDDFSYGITYGFARRFLPPKTGFRVFYDPDFPRMDDGGTSTRIHVDW
jgi:hypothetical protein